jgi:hypothetical protein
VVDLNDYNEQFTFIVNNETLQAMHNDSISKVQTIVIPIFFQILISKVKLKCSSKLLTIWMYIILMCCEFWSLKHMFYLFFIFIFIFLFFNLNF